jgi:hypothetical protein
MRIPLWRVAFLLAGMAMIAGGPRHPGPRLDLSFHDSTALMLADANWVPAHGLILASYLCLLAGVALWQRRAGLPDRVRTWGRFALVAIGLGVVEMALHTAAVLDLGRLRAGQPTPILTTHLWLTAVANPLLALALSGVALHGARLGRLGSRWIVWMPVLGGAGYGAASIYVVLTHDQRVSPLFAIGTSLLAFWFLLAAVWPEQRAPTEASAPATVSAS